MAEEVVLGCWLKLAVLEAVLALLVEVQEPSVLQLKLGARASVVRKLPVVQVPQAEQQLHSREQ